MAVMGAVAVPAEAVIPRPQPLALEMALLAPDWSVPLVTVVRPR